MICQSASFALFAILALSIVQPALSSALPFYFDADMIPTALNKQDNYNTKRYTADSQGPIDSESKTVQQGNKNNQNHYYYGPPTPVFTSDSMTLHSYLENSGIIDVNPSHALKGLQGSLVESPQPNYNIQESKQSRYVVFGQSKKMTTNHPLYQNASLDSQTILEQFSENVAYQVSNDNVLFSVASLTSSQATSLKMQGFNVMKDFKLDFHGDSPTPVVSKQTPNLPGQKQQRLQAIFPDSPQIPPSKSPNRSDKATGIPSSSYKDISRFSEFLGSKQAEKTHGLNGSGIRVAVMDTGTDFSNPDIRHSVARDKETNVPVMLDPDGQGIVLTNVTFAAQVDSKDGIIRSWPSWKDLPNNATSDVYVNRDGVFLDVAQGGSGTSVKVYNSLYPQAGLSPIIDGSISNDMKIGKNSRDFIESKSGVYHLGVIYQGVVSGSFARVLIIPVLVVDSEKAGVYDTIVPDLSTAYKDFNRQFEPRKPPNYDFDFTDETPIKLGDGNEFLVYDADDDGKLDYSAGTAGARVLDLWGVVEQKVQKVNATTNSNYTEIIPGEPAKIEEGIGAKNGTLLKPLDPRGNYFGVMYDFRGHGTASAASIASKGVQGYEVYNNSTKYSMRGMAPGAEIIPIKSLWFGDVIYGWLWAAGFDNKEIELKQQPTQIQDKNNNSKGIDNNTTKSSNQDYNNKTKTKTVSKWIFQDDTRADIVSNSWGISTFPNFGSIPGMDMLSLVSSVLTVPDSVDVWYPGVLFVNSAGNAGHGYGTMGTPSVSPYTLTVGATTNNVFVGYGPFSQQPRFGNHTTHYNEVVGFSSRGPGAIGDPKPDIMATGAYGFVPSSVIKTSKEEDKNKHFSMFGGTSMAAPLVAGSAALVMQGLNQEAQDYDPFKVKSILMSNAQDIGNDPFVQGAGVVDAKKATDYVKGKGNTFLVYNNASYNNVKKVIEKPISLINSSRIGLDRFQIGEQHDNYPSVPWFAGRLNQGERTTAKFTIENPTDRPMSVSIKPQKLDLVQRNTYDSRTTPRITDPKIDKKDAFAPNYVLLSETESIKDLRSSYGKLDPIPDDSSLMVLNVNFPFNEFMNKTQNQMYANRLKISSLYFYDWKPEFTESVVTIADQTPADNQTKKEDEQELKEKSYWSSPPSYPPSYPGVNDTKNNSTEKKGKDGKENKTSDGKEKIIKINDKEKDKKTKQKINKTSSFVFNKTAITHTELSLVNRGGSWATIQELRISDPHSKVTGIPLVGVYPVPHEYSYWRGDTNKNSTSMDYTLSASFYKEKRWDNIWVSQDSVTIPPNSKEQVLVTLAVPVNANPGVYQGTISFEGGIESLKDKHSVTAPVSYVVKKQVTAKDTPTVIRPVSSTENPDSEAASSLLYNSGYIGGGFDMTNRYNAGDWRTYYFDVDRPTINSASIDISWSNNSTSIQAFVVDPVGQIIQTNSPAGVLGAFRNWPTGDWLGTSRFSEGGGFYPIKNSNEMTSTILNTPVNQTGVYTLLLHATLLDGKTLTDPITVSTKFSTILPDDDSPEISITTPGLVNGTFSINPVIQDENLESIQYFVNDKLLYEKQFPFQHDDDHDDTKAVDDMNSDVKPQQQLQKEEDGDNSAKQVQKEKITKTSVPVVVDPKSLPDGTHRLTVRATDSVGHKTVKEMSFTIDNTPPDIVINSPQNNTQVSGETILSVDVTDSHIPKKNWLEIKLPDGKVIHDTKFVKLDTTTYQDGAHKIQILAQDESGNSASKTVEIQVRNKQTNQGDGGTTMDSRSAQDSEQLLNKDTSAVTDGMKQKQDPNQSLILLGGMAIGAAVAIVFTLIFVKRKEIETKSQ